MRKVLSPTHSAFGLLILRWTALRHWPLGRKVFALLLLTSLLPLVLLTGLILNRERTLVRAANVALLAARVDEVGNTLEAMHHAHQAAAARAARDPEIIGFCAGSPEARGRGRRSLLERLDVFHGDDPAIRGVGVLDRSGTVIAATETQLTGVNLAFRKYFQRALAGAGVSSDVYISLPATGGVPSIAFAAPVRSRAGEVVGVYLLWLRAQALWDVMRAANGTAGRGSYFILFDRHGFRVGHSAAEKLLFHPSAPVPEETARAMLADRRFQERTAELLAAVFPYPLQEMLGHERRIFRRHASPANQVDNLAAARQFPALGATLVAHVPESEFEVRVMSVLPRALPAFLVGLVFMLVGSALLMGHVVWPIRGLAGAAAAIERGDFTSGRGEGLAADVGAHDEIGGLTRAFRSMAGTLADRDRSLRARNRDLKQVLDNVGQGFLAMDCQGALSQERSAVVDQWFGNMRPGEPVWSFLGREDEEFAHRMRLAWTSLLDDQQPREAKLAQMPARLQRGERVFDLAYRLVEAQERIEQVIVVISDVTATLAKERDERQMRAELQQAQKMEAVGRLASGIAHDFNNVLVVILSCSKYLLEELPPNDPNLSEVKEIHEAGQRAARLVAQLLAFARKSPGNPVPTDLNAVVRDIEKLVRRSIGEDIEVSFALTPDPWSLCIDPGQLEQVILNLLVNARDAMPNGGKVVIETANEDVSSPAGCSCGPDGRQVVLRVSDTGCGMTPEVISKIFEPFFTTKERGKGTGLGLSTVFGIVQQSNGRIAVASEPGRGTTFTIHLPVCSGESEEESSPAARLDVRGHGAAVLLVEDEDGVRRVANRLLSRRGFRVIEARNGDEALLRFNDARVDLVLTDVVMPGMSGPDLAAQLRRLRPRLPVVFMSGYSDRQDVSDAGSVVLWKPFTEEALLGKLDEALTRADRPVTGRSC
jgi:two-component system, cell cycle sensor histidine kinase and response regulator CckA